MPGLLRMYSRYDLGEGQYLEFSPEVIDTFARHRQSPGRVEAGGILLGRVYSDSHVLVEEATTPNRRDRAGLIFFDRSRKAAQEIVNRAWHESDGERNYLGEWHTHSVPDPSPSPRDRQMIRNMFHDSINRVGDLFLVVVGLREIWVGRMDGRALRQISPLKEKDTR